MADLFQDKAADYDVRPVPHQISEGVVGCLLQNVTMDAARVKHILAVDVSPAMLEQLAKKPELEGKVTVICQNILEQPLDTQVDLVVSAMAMHHIHDTQALFHTLHAHLLPGGRMAIADLDIEDGDFHPPNTEGVFHSGFDRSAIQEKLEQAGFSKIEFATACSVERNEKRYPIFLVTAQKAEA